MPRRTSTEIIAALIQAFFEERSWTQADLARRARVSVETIRKTLAMLEGEGWPLERETEHPQVWWSLPKGWLPDGVLIPAAEIAELVRQLGRAPRSTARARLLGQVLRATPKRLERPEGNWLTAEVSRSEEAFLPLAEDAVGRKSALALR